MYDLTDLLRASIIPPEKTTEYMASTPTVDETMGSRPTAAHPLNKALDAMFVRNRTKKNMKNLQTQSSNTKVDSGSPYSTINVNQLCRSHPYHSLGLHRGPVATPIGSHGTSWSAFKSRFSKDIAPSKLRLSIWACVHTDMHGQMPKS